MSNYEISAEVKDFVFQYIDSVEQLEILLLLYSQAPKCWTSQEISDFLRSSPNSVEKRLSTLQAQKTVLESDEKGKYCYQRTEERIEKALRELNESYKVHKYKILEMIFSPMKKSRDFADAFKLSTTKDDKGDRNG
jgi:predicted metal-dependent hydrolase